MVNDVKGNMLKPGDRVLIMCTIHCIHEFNGHSKVEISAIGPDSRFAKDLLMVDSSIILRANPGDELEIFETVKESAA